MGLVVFLLQALKLGFVWLLLSVCKLSTEPPDAFPPAQDRKTNVLLCHMQKEKKHRGQKRGRRQKETVEKQEGTVKEIKRGEGAGFVVTSSSPIEGKMCVHMLQQSAWKTKACCIHSSRAIALMAAWLAKKIVISRIPSSVCSSSFHILFFPPAPQESAFCLPQEDSPSPGHRVTSVVFSFHLKDTGKH